MEATKLSTIYLDSERHSEIKENQLFQSLSDYQAGEVSKLSEIRTYSKGEHIYSASETGEFVFFIGSGSVKIYTKSPDGKEVIKSILHPGNILGEEILAGASMRVDYAKAIDPDVQLIVIQVEDLRSLMQRYWELNEFYIKLISQKLERTSQRVESLLVDDARKRVIDFLKYNAQHKGRKIGYELLIKHSMTQQDIANYTGTSRQTVTAILNDLRKTNQIYFKRNSILIRDVANLS